MTITLDMDAEYEQLLRDRAASHGMTVESFVWDLIEQELCSDGSQFQARLDYLRRAIAIGMEQAERGELVPFDPQATLDRVRQRKAQASEVR